MPFLTNHTEIHAWLAKYCVAIGSVFIAEDGVVNVDGSVVFHPNMLEYIAVQFGTVSGSFDARSCQHLKQLRGSPTHVGQMYSIDRCHSLIDLQGAPVSVGSFFTCCECQNLQSLAGLPLKVSGIYCDDCPQLRALSLQPSLKRSGPLYCRNCPLLDLALDSSIKVVKLTELPLPSVANFKKLMAHPVVFNSISALPLWCVTLENYYRSGDLLQLCAAYELLYGEPFLMAQDYLPTAIPGSFLL